MINTRFFKSDSQKVFIEATTIHLYSKEAVNYYFVCNVTF